MFDTSQNHRKKTDKSVFQSLAMIMQFGLNMLVPIALLSLAGYYLDRKMGTSWIFIAAFFVGAIAGFQNVYRMAMRVVNDRQKEQDREMLADDAGRKVQESIRKALEEDKRK